MHTDYELQVETEDDWKKHDHADHQAGAAYYDEVAQQSSLTPPATPEPLDTHHLKLARKYMENYQQVSAERYYHLCMMHAAIAQAEAATRQAEVTESMLEFAAELIGKTDIVSALLQWGYNQRTVG